MKFDAVPSIADALESTLRAFRSGDFGKAEAEAERALSLDFEEPSVQAALKSAVYWKDRQSRVVRLEPPELRADTYLKEWQGFVERFRKLLDEPFDAGVEAIRAAVAEQAAAWYLEQRALEDESRHLELELKASRALKASGAFDRAIELLEGVLAARPDHAGALAEMADCEEAVGESQRARLYFREAFYLNAQAVELSTLLSPTLNDLAARLQAQGRSGAELSEWLPVHAVIEGYFSVKRELKALELGQLKQSINTLKSELHAGGPASVLGLPRLLYRYFWLIDHYFSAKDDRSKIEDILLNIKLLDPQVYELYTH